MMIVGQTGCTMWTKRLVEKASLMIYPAPEKIIWCYTEWQEAYRGMEDMVEFREGLPDFEELKSSRDKKTEFLRFVFRYKY